MVDVDKFRGKIEGILAQEFAVEERELLIIQNFI
jgi:hypothetical protein